MSEEKVKRDDYCAEECVLVPLTDIYENADVYTLKMEMPGVTREKLDITIDNNELMIKGETERKAPAGKELKYSEYSDYNYFRKFTIGSDIDRNGIKATLDNGVLTLELKKSEEVKPKKIEISVG